MHINTVYFAVPRTVADTDRTYGYNKNIYIEMPFWFQNCNYLVKFWNSFWNSLARVALRCRARPRGPASRVKRVRVASVQKHRNYKRNVLNLTTRNTNGRPAYACSARLNAIPPISWIRQRAPRALDLFTPVLQRTGGVDLWSARRALAAVPVWSTD